MADATAPVGFFLSYTPREDALRRGYEAWLRETDNPFFNSVPGVHRYVNWRVASSPVPAVPFGWFDFLELDGRGAVDPVWSNVALQQFAANWTDLWGRVPDAEDLSINYQVFLCEGRRTAAGSETGWMVFRPMFDDGLPDDPRDPWRAAFGRSAGAGRGAAYVVDDACAASWRVMRPVLGTMATPRLDVLFLSDPDIFTRMVHDCPGLADEAVLARAVASPG